jgi:hypothetical protein
MSEERTERIHFSTMKIEAVILRNVGKFLPEHRGQYSTTADSTHRTDIPADVFVLFPSPSRHILG